MSSHIQLVENERVIGLDGRAWAATPVNDWVGFPFEVHGHMRHGEVAHRYNPNPLIFLRYGARGSSRILSGEQTYDLTVAPGQIDIYPAGFEMDHGSWRCTPGKLLAIELSELLLRRLLQDGGDRLRVRTTLSASDGSLAALVECVHAEVERGCPSGKLFADGLSLALVGYLQAGYSVTRREALPTHRLSKSQIKLIGEFVESHLGSDLRVTQLAALVKLSPHYFARQFRAAFGMTPHQYVLERRLEAARRMLRSDMAIADIAYALGFSSQAHFTQAFRRRIGSTPARQRLA